MDPKKLHDATVAIVEYIEAACFEFGDRDPSPSWRKVARAVQVFRKEILPDLLKWGLPEMSLPDLARKAARPSTASRKAKRKPRNKRKRMR